MSERMLIRLSPQPAKNDTRLTATPDFASGVNQRSSAVSKNAEHFAAQVDAAGENLSTRPKWLAGLGLVRRKGFNGLESPST